MIQDDGVVESIRAGVALGRGGEGSGDAGGDGLGAGGNRGGPDEDESSDDGGPGGGGFHDVPLWWFVTMQ